MIEHDFRCVREQIAMSGDPLNAFAQGRAHAALDRIVAERAELRAALEEISNLQRNEGAEQHAFSLLRQCGAIARGALANGDPE